MSKRTPKGRKGRQRQFEEPAVVVPPTPVPAPSAPNPASPQPSEQTKGKDRKPTELEIREAGRDCPDMAAAGERLGRADLEGILKRFRRLSAAWERGQLLRRVKDVASTTVVVPERADRLLSLAKGSFEHLYATDRIVREIWNRERFAVLVEIERALVTRVKEGDLKAVTAVEHLFGHRTESAGEVKFHRLTPTVLETATGIKRAQWDRWTKEGGLPRGADGTYALVQVIDWLRRWERDKASGGKESLGLNPMQAEKARMYKLQADEAEGRLLDRPTVIRMFRERAARLVQLLSEATADQWSHAHEGKTAVQLKAAYLETFRKLRSLWKEFPAEIPLPPEARAKIEEGLQLLISDV